MIDLDERQGGGNIGRVLIIESNEGSHSIIDEIIETLKKHPEFELLWLKHEPVLSLPGLEIDPLHRKVYCDKLEINLTAKEYDLLRLFVANKGCVLTYDQIYRKVWGEEAFGDANNAIACHVVTCDILQRSYRFTKAVLQNHFLYFSH